MIKGVGKSGTFFTITTIYKMNHSMQQIVYATHLHICI